MKVAIEAQKIVDELGENILDVCDQELEIRDYSEKCVLLVLDGHKYLIKREELRRVLAVMAATESPR